MPVLQAFLDTWARRGVVVPIFIAVRVLSLAILIPATTLIVGFAISLSGQSALTDQAIAHFFVSPLGLPVFLFIAAVLLVGSVIGLAAMTVDLTQENASTAAALKSTFALLARRLPALIQYAVRLVIRILLIVAPVAIASLLIAQNLFGQYDINFYLSTHPPEFLIGAGIIAGLMAIMGVILLNRLLLWAVSLHCVLLDGVTPRASFEESAQIMRGKRLRLLKTLALWFAIRTLLALCIALIFEWLISDGAALAGTGFRIKLTIALGLGALWSLCSMVLGAISLGALARLLYQVQSQLRHRAPVQGSPLMSTGRLAAGLIGLVVFGLVAGGVMINSVQTNPTVEVIAHRGAAGARPENTLASIRKAIEDGADWVEIDVQETADGDVVVMHDSDFMKIAGVDLKIWEATRAQLDDIDIGSWFDPVYAGERTPMLADVLEITRDKAQLLIELKYYGHDTSLEERTIALVENAGLADQVATMSLKYPAVTKMKQLRPEWRAGVLAATAIGDLSRLDADFIAVSTNMAGPRLVRSARRQGKKLYVWTVNDPLEMSAMMSLGVDGIITDEPGMARQVMQVRSELSTPERLFVLLAERFGLTQDAGEYRDDAP
ncbi:MAG: glycerophosphodiester phosphodiesterase [Paracoccaceae bacterium]|nr:glycerophosphodiester phosphodiesterase [Paracoccaceae bacterium]